MPSLILSDNNLTRREIEKEKKPSKEGGFRGSTASPRMFFSFKQKVKLVSLVKCEPFMLSALAPWMCAAWLSFEELPFHSRSSWREPRGACKAILCKSSSGGESSCQSPGFQPALLLHLFSLWENYTFSLFPVKWCKSNTNAWQLKIFRTVKSIY